MACQFPNFTVETVVEHHDTPQLTTFAACGVDLEAVKRQERILDELISRLNFEIDTAEHPDTRNELKQDIALITSLSSMLNMIRSGAGALYVPLEPVGRILY